MTEKYIAHNHAISTAGGTSGHKMGENVVLGSAIYEPDLTIFQVRTSYVDTEDTFNHQTSLHTLQRLSFLLDVYISYRFHK